MTKDATDRSEGAPTIESPSSSLSAQVFANPADFLQVLKSDFKQIAQTDPKKISQSDLIAYSEHGSDPQGRVAAKIAAEHYGDLQAIASSPLGRDAAPPDGISVNDLQADTNLVNGNIQGPLKTVRENDSIKIAEGAIATGVGATGAASTFLECPPVGMLIGAAGLAAGGATGYFVKDLFEAPERLKAESAKDQQMVNSWLYADGGQKGPPSMPQPEAAKVVST
jgi:hypothetical protein